MKSLGLAHISGILADGAAGTLTEYVVVQRPLRRVLAFCGRSIDDLVNNPIVKNEVFGFYKLSRQIARHADLVDLERQWGYRS